MADVSAKTDGQLILDLVLGGLRVRDERLNELAAEFLVRRGPQAVPRLVREATNKKNTPAHHVRALEIIARIGPPYPVEILDLSILLRVPSKAVQAAAREVLGYGPLASGMTEMLAEQLAALK